MYGGGKKTSLSRFSQRGGGELLLAIEAGSCEAAVVASDAVAELYLQGRGQHIALHWPSADDGGVQLNVTGVGVARHAENPLEAAIFVDWLASADGQKIMASSGNDYPVNLNVSADAPLDGWAGFDTSEIDSMQLGYLIPDVVLLNERAAYR